MNNGDSVSNYANREVAVFMCTLQVDSDYVCLFSVNDWPGPQMSGLHVI